MRHAVPKRLDRLAALATQAQRCRKTGRVRLGPQAADWPAPRDSVPGELVPLALGGGLGPGAVERQALRNPDPKPQIC